MVTAQVLTGALVGTVKDEQGAALPGASVRVWSAALIGGALTVTTNDRGQLRFPVLPPGTYAIDIELPGFAPYREQDITIGTGTTLERTAVLKVAGIAESIVVEGSGSRIEARSSGFETRIGPEYLQTIPTRRYSMFDAIRAAPGVSPTSASSGTVNTVSAFGSGGNENLFLIDGTNFTCPCAGVSRAEPSVDVIQEMQVQSVGVSAEYGNIQGAVFNVVTKQGGDRFQYDASYYGQVSDLTSQPVLRPVPGGESSSGYERIRYRDFTTDLGGPVVRERLWFFTGYQYLRDYDSQPGADPALPRTYQQNKLFGKLTWRFTPGLQLMQSCTTSPGSTLNARRPSRRSTRRRVRMRRAGDHLRGSDAHSIGQYRLGAPVWAGSSTIASMTRARATVRRPAGSTGRQASPAMRRHRFGGLMLIRTSAKATLTHYRPRLFGADHELKAGTQIEKGEHYGPGIIPGGVRYIDNSGQPFQAISAPPSNAGGLFITAAAFATDAMTIGERVTLNAGIRFDHSRAISQDLNAVDAEGHETSEIIQGLGTLYTWNLLSPRVGVTARLISRRTNHLARELWAVQPGRVDGRDQPHSSWGGAGHDDRVRFHDR